MFLIRAAYGTLRLQQWRFPVVVYHHRLFCMMGLFDLLSAACVQVQTTVLERLRTTFLQYGWLTPAFLPLTMIVGRGLFNTVFFLYLFWALLGVRSLRIEHQRLLLVLYGLLLGSYALGIVFAVDIARALGNWSTLVAYSASVLITLAMLQRHQDNLRHLLALFGLMGLITLGAAFLDLLLIFVVEEEFIPRLQLEAVNLIIYLPFMLAWIWTACPPGRKRVVYILITIALLSGYIVLSEERSSFVSLTCGLICLGIFVLRIPVSKTLLLAVGLIVIALLFNGEHLLRGLSSSGDFFGQLDALSSGRLTLWKQALENPPDSLLFGAGMGNARYYLNVVSINGHIVKHLHNIWLDAWFDTGLLGLIMLVSSIAYIFSRTAGAWPAMTDTHRFQAGIFLSAAVTLLTQAQFSISYASREIGIYFFLCLVVLSHLSRVTSAGNSDAQR